MVTQWKQSHPSVALMGANGDASSSPSLSLPLPALRSCWEPAAGAGAAPPALPGTAAPAPPAAPAAPSFSPRSMASSLRSCSSSEGEEGEAEEDVSGNCGSHIPQLSSCRED